MTITILHPHGLADLQANSPGLCYAATVATQRAKQRLAVQQPLRLTCAAPSCRWTPVARRSTQNIATVAVVVLFLQAFSPGERQGAGLRPVPLRESCCRPAGSPAETACSHGVNVLLRCAVERHLAWHLSMAVGWVRAQLGRGTTKPCNALICWEHAKATPGNLYHQLQCIS